MKTIITIGAVVATTAGAAGASSLHPYRHSFEAGDYQYCLKTDGSPGCMYHSMQQCQEDRLGRGGFCWVKLR